MSDVYLPNAFWTNWQLKGEDKENITALKRLNGGDTIQISANKGSNDYKNLISQLTEKLITENTIERFNKKENEKTEKYLREEQKNKSKLLEDLFSHKLRVFESDIIKNSKNRQIKSKIRKAKTPMEVNAFATLLIGIEEGIIDERSQ